MLTLELNSWGAIWTIVPTPIRFLEVHAFAFTAFSTSAKTSQQKEGKRTLSTQSDHCHNRFVIGSSTDIPEGAQLWPAGVRGAGEALGRHAFTSYKASFQLQHKSIMCLSMDMFLGPQLQTQELGFIIGLQGVNVFLWNISAPCWSSQKTEDVGPWVGCWVSWPPADALASSR